MLLLPVYFLRACLNFFPAILAKAASKLTTIHGLKAVAI